MENNFPIFYITVTCSISTLFVLSFGHFGQVQQSWQPRQMPFRKNCLDVILVTTQKVKLIKLQFWIFAWLGTLNILVLGLVMWREIIWERDYFCTFQSRVIRAALCSDCNYDWQQPKLYDLLQRQFLQVWLFSLTRQFDWRVGSDIYDRKSPNKTGSFHKRGLSTTSPDKPI